MTDARELVPKTSWVSAHLFYHGSADLMLRELVGPLVESLREQELLAKHFFLRYWQSGPHIRLRVLPERDDDEEIRSRLAGLAGLFFEAYPSSSRWKETDLQRMARVLAKVEPDAEPTPLEPNNSFKFFPYQPERRKYGEGPSMEAVEQHFTESSDLALSLISRDLQPRRKRSVAFAALVTAATMDSETLDQLAIRLDYSRRMWGAVTGLAGTGGETRVTETYTRCGEELRTIVFGMWERPWSARDPNLDYWRQSVGNLSRQLHELEAVPGFGLPGQSSPWRIVSPEPDSAFIIDNCAHLLCNRLGVPLADEWFLRSLAARAAADVRGGVPHKSAFGSG